MKKHTEQELREIIKKVMSENRLNEALGGGSADMSSIDKLKSKYPNGFKMTTVTASGSATFANGVDTVNYNPQTKNIIDNILAACGYNYKDDGSATGCSRKISVTVDGGASAVGSESGFDNKSLAERRRDNLINFLLNNVDIIPKEVSKKMIKIIKGSAIVGTATVKNSPQAQKEQFVRVNITSESNIPVKGVEGDNTNVALNNYNKKIGKDKKDIFDTTVKYKRVCVQIPVGLIDEFKQKIREYKAENGGMAVPFGIYDIKK